MKVINFPNLAKNTFPHIEKYLTLGGMKLPGSQLHLIHWRKKNCSGWFGKILEILQIPPPAQKAGYSHERSCVFPSFCTMPCAEGADVGEAMLARSPVLATQLNPSQLLLCLVSWSRAAFSLPVVCSCLEIKFDHPASCFFIPSSIILWSIWLEKYMRKQNRFAGVQSVPCLGFVFSYLFWCQTWQSTSSRKLVM